MRHLALAALALSLLAPVAAKADPVDMSTVTCGSLLTMDESAVTFMLTWVAGYMAGTEEELSMDPDALGKSVDATVKYCQENEEMSVLNAARETAE